jgi:hypothetical protein
MKKNIEQPEDRERHQGVALAALDHDECREQHGRAGEPQHGPRRAPTDVDRVDHRVDEQREAGGNRHGAGNVKAFRAVFGMALEQHPGSQCRRGDTDRDVHEQHPAPAQSAREDAAQQNARGAAGARDGAPDAECTVALRTFRERGRDDRQRGRRDDRGAEALDRTGGQQPCLGLSKPAAERGEREHDQADHEHAPAPEQVGEPPAEQQEASKGERVRVHDP